MRCPSIRLSVCPSVTFVNSAKTSKHVLNFFHCRLANHSNISHQTLWQYSDGEYSWPISGFRIGDWWSVINNFDRGLIYSTKCGSTFIAQTATHQRILFITASIDDHARRREQNRIVRIGKSEAEVTNNKRLRSRYCTVEAKYRDTRSIERPLCESRVSCIT